MPARKPGPSPLSRPCAPLAILCPPGAAFPYSSRCTPANTERDARPSTYACIPRALLNMPLSLRPRYPLATFHARVLLRSHQITFLIMGAHTVPMVNDFAFFRTGYLPVCQYARPAWFAGRERVVASDRAVASTPVTIFASHLGFAPFRVRLISQLPPRIISLSSTEYPHT